MLKRFLTPYSPAALIRLAHSLGIGVVAEGVEHDLALGLLRQMDCDLVQGSQVCQPLPALDFERWYASYLVRRPALVASQRAIPN